MTDTTTTTGHNAMIWELPKGYFVREGILYKEVVTEVNVTDAAGNETAQEVTEHDFVYWRPLRVKSLTKLASGTVFELEGVATSGNITSAYYDVKHLTKPDSMLLRAFIPDGIYASSRREKLRGFFMDSIEWLHQKESDQPVT
jgi:hypothetical protein